MKCDDCGAELVQLANPFGPETLCEGTSVVTSNKDGLVRESDIVGYNFGCLQRAFDQWDGKPTSFGNEPEAPYPPHRVNGDEMLQTSFREAH